VSSLLVLTAIDAEAHALGRFLGLPAVPRAAFAHYRHDILEVAAVGIRATALGERLPRCRPATLVISAGVCGALAPTLEQGDLVVPEAVLDARGACWATATLAGLPRRGTLLWTDAIASDAATKSRLWLETGALAIDMESGTIMNWAQAHGVPAAVVRGVSDTAREAVPSDLAGVIGQDGRTRPLLVVHAALARPSSLRDAMTLRRGMQAAVASVSRALTVLASQTGSTVGPRPLLTDGMPLAADSHSSPPATPDAPLTAPEPSS